MFSSLHLLPIGPAVYSPLNLVPLTGGVVRFEDIHPLPCCLTGEWTDTPAYSLKNRPSFLSGVRSAM